MAKESIPEVAKINMSSVSLVSIGQATKWLEKIEVGRKRETENENRVISFFNIYLFIYIGCTGS